jgi:hypothetical protein
MDAQDLMLIGVEYLRSHYPEPDLCSADDLKVRRAKPLPLVYASPFDGCPVPIALDGVYDDTGRRAGLAHPVDPSHVVS